MLPLDPTHATRSCAVVPIPLGRCRPPSPALSPLHGAAGTAHVAVAREAERTRAMTPAALAAHLGAVLRRDGYGGVAQLLDDNAAAIGAFRAALATLADADRRLTQAAAELLAGAGVALLPPEVR